MDKLHDEDFPEDDFQEHEAFSTGQLIIFFVLALPTTVALQALGFGWDAAVACITASGLAAAFGPQLYRIAKERRLRLHDGSSPWHGLLLPPGETHEEAVEGTVQGSHQSRWQAPDDDGEETGEDEDWWEQEAFAAPASAFTPVLRSAPGATWQQTTMQGPVWEDPADEEGATEHRLDLAPTLVVHPDAIFSGRVLVAGLPGSGKSNTMRRMIEECGRLGLPFLLIDTDGEYASLLPYLRNGVLIGASNRMGVPAAHFAAIDRAEALRFGKLLLSENWQAIFDVKSYTEYYGRPDENTAALVFMDIIYGMRAWQEARPPRERIPSMIFLEEAQVWLPQQPSSSTLNRITLRDLQALFFRSARDGRRRGIGLVIIAHRIAGIHKEVLSCDWMILHQPQATDLKRYLDLVPSVPRERFQRLVRGRAIVVSPTGTREVSFHRARSQDNGVTPGLSALHRYQEQAASRLPISHTPMQASAATMRLPETLPVRERPYRPMEKLTREEEERLGPIMTAEPSKPSRQPTELEQTIELWKSGKVHSIRGIERELGVSYHRAGTLFKEMKTRRVID